MSGTIPADTLTAPEVVDLRRFCGYSPIRRPGSVDPIDEILPLLDTDIIAIIRVYLANLRLLETDLPAMRKQLNVAQAAVFTRNPLEQTERNQLFRDQRRALCLMLAIPTGPNLYTMVPGVFVV